MREILSIAADIASIVAAFCAAGALLKLTITVRDSGNKAANQRAIGSNNKQKISQ